MCRGITLRHTRSHTRTRTLHSLTPTAHRRRHAHPQRVHPNHTRFQGGRGVTGARRVHGNRAFGHAGHDIDRDGHTRFPRRHHDKAGKPADRGLPPPSQRVAMSWSLPGVSGSWTLYTSAPEPVPASVSVAVAEVPAAVAEEDPAGSAALPISIPTNRMTGTPMNAEFGVSGTSFLSSGLATPGDM